LGFAEKTLSEIWYKLKVDGFSNLLNISNQPNVN